MSNPLKYPRWVVNKDGERVLVQDHLQHSEVTGRKYDENAELVEAPVSAFFEPTDADIITMFARQD